MKDAGARSTSSRSWRRAPAAAPGSARACRPSTAGTRRVIHSRTVVMIVSDGYETGDAALLGREMAALGRRCRRIVWLNPMMAWEGYAPRPQASRRRCRMSISTRRPSAEEPDRLEPYLAKALDGRPMSAHVEVMDLVAQMKSAEQPFVLATVVRTVSVTAAKAGAKAIIRPDGTIVAGLDRRRLRAGAVLKAAREALLDGEPRMVSVRPKISSPSSASSRAIIARASASPATCVRARAPWISSSSRCCRIPRW